MHGSTGVQLCICTVDPSGSRVVTRCIGVPVEQHRHNTNTQLLSSRGLARSCHTHTNLPAAYRCQRLSRYGDYHYYHQWVSDWETECDRRRSPWQQLGFPLGSTEALFHNHQGGFQKISNSKPWRTDVNQGEASSESWLLEEELEIWPNYGKRDDRVITFRSRSQETISIFFWSIKTLILIKKLNNTHNWNLWYNIKFNFNRNKAKTTRYDRLLALFNRNSHGTEVSL